MCRDGGRFISAAGSSSLRFGRLVHSINQHREDLPAQNETDGLPKSMTEENQCIGFSVPVVFAESRSTKGFACLLLGQARSNVSVGLFSHLTHDWSTVTPRHRILSRQGEAFGDCLGHENAVEAVSGVPRR